MVCADVLTAKAKTAKKDRNNLKEVFIMWEVYSFIMWSQMVHSFLLYSNAVSHLFRSYVRSVKIAHNEEGIKEVNFFWG